MLLPALIRVLHVDDEESQREFAKMFLEQDGVIQVTSAASGKEALQLLEKESNDCIVSDYQMPGMDGIMFARRVREKSRIPFIIYTGRGSEEVAESAFMAGVDNYVRKEVEPSHYLVLARNIVQVVERRWGEDQYVEVVENSRDAILIIEGTRVSWANQAACDLTGAGSIEELVGEYSRWVVEEDCERVTEIMLAGQRGESVPSRYEFSLRRVNREVRIVEASGSLISFRGKRANQVFLRDITDRKRMEEELRESEERYRTLVENSPNAISVLIGDTIVYANQRRAELAGKNDPSELVGTSALSQVAEGDREPIIKIREARERGEKSPSPFEYRMLRTDGSVRDIMDYHSEIKYQGTNAVQHVLHDVTDQKRYERRLEALHRHATELGKAGTIDDVAERTLDAIKSVLGYNQGGFGLVEGSVLHFIRMIGVSVGEGFELPLDGKGVTVRAVGTGKTQFVADIRKNGDYELGPAGRELKSLSEMAVPVKIDGKAAAIINVESEKLDAFNEEDRKLLEIFAEHVASAISRYREEAEHRRYEQSLEALHRHASELQLAGNVQQVCELTLDAMEQTLDFKDASFLFVEKGVLKEKGVRGTPILDMSLPLDGKGITVKAANTRRTVLVNDLRGDHDFVRGPIDSLSELATPVLIDGETVAVLNVESLDLNAFTREDQILLETLSQHVASALKRLGNLEVLRASVGRRPQGSLVRRLPRTPALQVD
jgi:PAS domain S-box-containing protein